MPKKKKATTESKRKTALKRLSDKAIRRNPWLEHIDETIKKNPLEKSYKNILKKASITYNQRPAIPTSKRPSAYMRKKLGASKSKKKK